MPRVSYRAMIGADLLDRRLLIVSGKGGVGKTTVAAALARGAARGRRRVLLAEVEGRGGVSRLLNLPAPGFEERPTPLGFSITEIAPREALVEYLWMFFGMRALSRTLARARVVEMATDGIPGFRDLMTAGKLYELTEWRRHSGSVRGRSPYDLVVVDAPPTGQLLPLLRAPSAFLDIIRMGRPHRQLESIDRLLRRVAGVVLVAIPEEMSVVETLETADALRDEGIPCRAVIVNRVLPPAFPRGTRTAAHRLRPAALVKILAEAGQEAEEADAASLLQVARAQDDRVRAQQDLISTLSAAGPLSELPFLFTRSFGPAEVDALSRELVP
ncbi:MAG: AAA family ATPase [Actinomycetota bacterium]|nr:AAA family ATPase [Actinomycetota bacterium]